MSDAPEAPETPEAHQLRVAGLSREAPRTRYEVDGLSFGRARLSRQENPPWGWSELALELSAEAAAQSATQGGSDARTVRINPYAQMFYIGRRSDEIERAPDGLCALLTTHALLSHPALLWEPAPNEAFDESARRSLAALRASYARLTRGVGPRLGGTLCDACAAVAAQRLERVMTASDATFAKRLKEARSPREAQLIHYEMQGARSQLRYQSQTHLAPDCPHATMRHEALRGLFERFAELSFEGVGLLVPMMEARPPRYALDPKLLKLALGPWLTGRSAHAASSLQRGFDPWRSGVRSARPRVRKATDDASRATDAALTYAARAWGFSGEDAAARGETSEEGDAPDLVAEAPEPQTSVAVVLPAGVQIEAPPAPKPARKAKEPRGEPPAPKGEADANTEYMASQLRAMGHDDAAIKRMLKSGELERVAFGWYRFTKK